MDLICGACSQPNAVHARYCAGCGAPMDDVEPTSPHSPVANFALIVAAVLSVMAASAAIGGAGAADINTVIERDYFLRQEKSHALFELLRPKDVKVFVSQDDGLFTAQGNEWEIAVLDDFVELVTRYDGQSQEAVSEYIDRAAKISNTDRSYRLPRAKTEALHNVLKPADVPVLAGKQRRRVSVQATEKDQKTISNMVRILSGKRSECDGLGCLFKIRSKRRPRKSIEVITPGAQMHSYIAVPATDCNPTCDEDR
ncbi:MAG: hypothetical protein JSU63_10165 [Phycisphaerales bacterium]|nr:MAG: hypothetical protein JSU63_10165 [Phycisphaerales bacterium]